MVEQLGLAMMPRFLYWAMAWAFTSGTTKGISGSMRKALLLSTTTAPEAAAAGPNSRLREAPAEKRATWTPLKESLVSFSTLTGFPPNSNSLPTERSEANNLMEPTGNFRCSRVLIISKPTAPVAPATATAYDFPFILHLPHKDLSLWCHLKGCREKMSR